MNKNKKEVNYRKSIIASENSRFRRCKFCKHKQLIELRGIDGNHLGHGYRCSVIGLEMSRQYVVKHDHVCDRVEVKKQVKK